MSYITTWTGKHFDPVAPNPEEIAVVDMAHALSLMCRANGHTKFFYSVAQHSIACAKEAIARGESREVILGCLLHDGSEAYLSDVTRPVKKALTYYLSVEEKLQDMIWAHCIGRELDAEEKAHIFEIDDQMLSMEFHQLMPEDVDDSYRSLVRVFECRYESPEIVEQRFVQMVKEAGGNL